MAAALFMASDSFAFERTDRGDRERQSLETASQAEALFQTALCLSDKPNTEPARRDMQEAVRIWVQIHEPEKAAKALMQIGEHCRREKKYLDALKYYRQALDFKTLAKALSANALNAIGLVFADLYVRDLAVRYFKQALEQADIINDLSAQTIALTGLADISRQNGALEKSLEFVTKALQLREKNHAGADAALLCSKGRLDQQLGLIQDARRAFEMALAIYRNTSDVRGQVRVLCAFSKLSLYASNKQGALDQAEEARKLADKEVKRAVTDGDYLRAFELREQASLVCARAERALGLNAEALKSYFWSTGSFQGTWIGIYTSSDTSAMLSKEDIQVAYREYVDLLMEQGQFMKGAEVAESSVARALLALGGARATPRFRDSKQDETMRELSRTIYGLRSALLTPGLSREKRRKMQDDLEETEFKIEESRLQYEMEHTKERRNWSQQISPEELQEKTAQDQMSLAEFYLGENRSFVWLFARGQFFYKVLPSRKEIENAVKPYLGTLAAPPNPLYIDRDLAKLRGQSEALFAMLFGGLSDHIAAGDRLIIVPDGVLHYLPFETLVHNERYLVEDHQISYSPSASTLVKSQNSKGGVEPGGRMDLLAFGDPIFGADIRASVTRKTRKRPIDVLRDARTSSGFHLAPLPRTRDEVQYIANLFPADRTRIYLGKDSTEDAVKRESLRQYRRLHFATHSLIDETSPSRSAVVLTLKDSPDEDGFLEVNEIYDLDLDCDLVVLSACQTGRGQLLSGEGIVGLSRAFLYAGARSVVVSLWSVSDISTGHLMKNFYQHLAGNLGNAAALRLAKLEMLHSVAETRHPYYWAPFIAIGKP